MKLSAEIKVTGRVQGVGYRFYVYRNAELLGLTGYVKNCTDGTVELRVEGEKEMIERLRVFLKDGPRFSKVEYVNLNYVDYQAKYTKFSVEY